MQRAAAGRRSDKALPCRKRSANSPVDFCSAAAAGRRNDLAFSAPGKTKPVSKRMPPPLCRPPRGPIPIRESYPLILSLFIINTSISRHEPEKDKAQWMPFQRALGNPIVLCGEIRSVFQRRSIGRGKKIERNGKQLASRADCSHQSQIHIIERSESPTTQEPGHPEC